MKFSFEFVDFKILGNMFLTDKIEYQNEKEYFIENINVPSMKAILYKVESPNIFLRIIS